MGDSSFANVTTTQGIVLHAGTDDYGLGGDAGSMTTGNAGSRLACGCLSVYQNLLLLGLLLTLINVLIWSQIFSFRYQITW